uniref:Uncharacterized protein n=1 Tax=Arundo donax TaxID=35708 RepID=A0A0A8ZEL2_ARUDO
MMNANMKQILQSKDHYMLLIVRNLYVSNLICDRIYISCLSNQVDGHMILFRQL